MPYMPWCYLCQLGDPHDVHMTDEDHYAGYIPPLTVWGIPLGEYERMERTMGTYDPIAAKRARLEREIRRVQTELDALELVPTEDVYADGTIIRAEILNPGKRDPTTYVFLKVSDPQGVSTRNPSGVRWYHTGWIQHNPGASRGNTYQLTYFQGWSELQKWMAESGRVVETWTVMSAQQATFPIDTANQTSER